MGQQWKRQLLSTLIVASNFCHIIAQNYNDETANIEGFDFPEVDTYPNDLQKRLSKFVRIGRGLSSFIRIGRQSPYEELDVYQSTDIPNAIDDDTGDNGNSAFFDLDPDNIDKPAKRLSSFVRIGKNYNARNDFGEQNTVKRGGAFIRMGKFPSSAYLRNRPLRVNGLAPQPYYHRTGRIGHSSFIRIGKRDTTDALRRMLEQNTEQSLSQSRLYTPHDKANDINDDDTETRRYLKIGRDAEIEQDITNESNTEEPENRRYLKIGRDAESKHDEKDLEGKHGLNKQPLNSEDQQMSQENTQQSLNKRLSNFVRIGRGDTSSIDVPEFSTIPQQKRLSTFVRIGKSDKKQNKRMSSFVRIGKRQNGESEITKRRMSSFVRIGKGSIPLDQNTAGKMEVMVSNDKDLFSGNADKRMSSFVRIGKNPEQSDNTVDKRISSFVRIGKSGNNFGNDLVKRISSFVRIGRDYPYSENDFNKRLSSFIRVGKNYPRRQDGYDKRFSSFVRIGKTFPPLTDTPDKRMSSFVRIGKNTGNGYNKRLSSFIRVGKDNYISKDLDNGILEDINTAYTDDVDKGAIRPLVRLGNTEQSDQQATD